jgi:uncharacterized Tic20 family protein
MTVIRRQPRARPYSSTDDKLWATIAHFGGLLWFVPSLAVFVALRQRPSLARQEAKEAVNWQITFTILYTAIVIAEAVLAGILLLTPAGSVVPALGVLPLALYAVNVVLSIRGGLRANGGESFRYPFAIRLIR